MMDGAFTYSWRITEFSLCANRKGDAIHSHSFETQILKNTKWTLQLYPRGHKDDSFVSLFLQRCSKDEGPEVVKLEFTFQLLGSDGGPVKVKTTTVDFRKQNDAGFPDFITRRDLFSMASVCLQNDVLNIRCILKLIEMDQFQTKHVFSRTVIPVERTNFNWQVKDFSKMTDKDRVTTSVFFQSGPDPQFEASLTLDRQDKEVLIKISRVGVPKRSTTVIKVRIVLLDCHGIETEFSKEEQHYFISNSNPWQFPVFLYKASLLGEKHKYLVDDVLTLRFVFTVSAGTIHSKIERTIRTAVDTGNEICKSQLTMDMTRLYQEKEYSDVQLRASGEVVPAHKAVLESRSRKFSEMLDIFEDSDALESGVMDVPDMDMCTLKNILKYMYTEEVNDMSYEDTVKLFIAAHEYVIMSLKYKCSLYLQCMLKVGNVCDALKLADDYVDSELKHYAVGFINNYWDEVSLSDEWLELTKTRKALVHQTKERLLVKRLYL